MMPFNRLDRSNLSRWLNASWLVAAAMVVAFLSVGSAPMLLAASVDERLESAEGKVEQARGKEGVLTKDIEALGDRVRELEREIVKIRGREAAAEAELAARERELDEAVVRLQLAEQRLRRERARLVRSLKRLRGHLVSVYTSGTTDISDLILNTEGFDELVSTGEYLESIQNQGESLAARVRSIRDQARRQFEVRRESKVEIESARNQIAAERQQLEDARSSLEVREGAVATRRAQREQALATVEEEIVQHEQIAEDLRAKVETTIAEASVESSIPAGPLSAPSSSGMIWPVDGVLTSTFGPRWGSSHEGIDISAAEGTPIRAADSGTVILLQTEAESGGYGNYTCVDHGNAISTCYAHQSGFNTTSGATVAQGEIIGYVGNTGHSFGAHLHFEVRISGVATDPLSYL